MVSGTASVAPARRVVWACSASRARATMVRSGRGAAVATTARPLPVSPSSRPRPAPYRGQAAAAVRIATASPKMTSWPARRAASMSLGATLDGHPGNRRAGQHVGDQLADTAIAHDQHLRPSAAELSVGRRASRLALVDARRARRRPTPGRECRTSTGSTTPGPSAPAAVQQAFARGRMQDDEGELAARGQKQRGLDGRRRTEAEQPRQAEDDGAVEHHEPTSKPTISTGFAASSDRSRPMPTDTKNSPSSRPLKGSTVLSTSLRYSVSASSRPAMKAPSAIDSPLTARDQAGPDHDQQRCRDEQLFAVGLGDRTHHRTQHEAAQYHEDQQTERRRSEGQQQLRREGLAAMAAEDGDRHQDRRHGKILQQQHRESRPPGPRELTLLLGQQRHHDGRRRQRQRRPEQRRRPPDPGPAASPRRRWRPSRRRPASRPGRRRSAASSTAAPRTVPARWRTAGKRRRTPRAGPSRRSS